MKHETKAPKAPKAVDCFEKGIEDALTVLNLPTQYRRRLMSTNLAERFNEEIRRAQRVIRIFPNDESAVRFAGGSI